jgi:hypothetical protein
MAQGADTERCLKGTSPIRGRAAARSLGHRARRTSMSGSSSSWGVRGAIGTLLEGYEDMA